MTKTIAMTMVGLIITIVTVAWMTVDIDSYILGYENESGSIFIEGWDIFWKAWFFFLPGALVAFAITAPVVFIFYRKALVSDANRRYELEKQSHSWTREELTEQMNIYEKRAESAHHDATVELSASFDELEREKELAQEKLAEAKQLKKEAEKIKTEARESVRRSSIELRRAEKKKNNAVASLQRKKLVIEKLRASQHA